MSDTSTDEWFSEPFQSRWLWWMVVGLVVVHIGAGIAVTLITPTAPEGLLGVLAGLAAGLAIVLAVGQLVRIYLSQRT